MKITKIFTFAFLFAAVILAALPISPVQAYSQSGDSLKQPAPASLGEALPNFKTFVKAATSGHPDLVAAVYVPGVMALRVLQQPTGNPAFVSSEAETATQFGLATQYKTIGLLAHNNLAGSQFSNLQLGQTIYLILGDGSVRYYRVTHIHRYQALSPTSPYSNFVDLDNPGQQISSTDLFTRIFIPATTTSTTTGGTSQLVFQTCIAANGNSSWGRLFVTAEPISPQI